MARSVNPTRKFNRGILGKTNRETSPGLFEMFDLATRYKKCLSLLYQRQNREEINTRNDLFPQLWAAIQLEGRHRDLIAATVFEIKKANSDQRTRESATYARSRLELLKAQLDTMVNAHAPLRDAYFVAVKQAAEEYKSLPAKWEAANPRTPRKGQTLAPFTWKNIKSLDLRRRVLRESHYSSDIARRLVGIIAKYDLRAKELSAHFQKLGLGSGTRGEIGPTVAPLYKRGGKWRKRYSYHKPYDVQAATQLTTQVGGGGSTLEELIIKPRDGLYIKECTRGDGPAGYRYYHIKQNTGTKAKPKYLAYTIVMDAPLPAGAKIQRWSTRLDETGKPYAQITVSHPNGFPKPLGAGLFAYDLNFRRVTGGYRVFTAIGDEVQESLILSDALISRLTYRSRVNEWLDAEAGRLLDVRGIREKSQRLKSIRAYFKKHPDDAGLKAYLDLYADYTTYANRVQLRARRTRTNLFQHIVAGLRKSHGRCVPDTVDITNLKLRGAKPVEDTNEHLPQCVKRAYQILGVGELRTLVDAAFELVPVDINNTSNTCPKCLSINNDSDDDSKHDRIRVCSGCGDKWDRDIGACEEMLARADVPRSQIGLARDTDLFTSYVKSVDPALMPEPAFPNWYSQVVAKTQAA